MRGLLENQIIWMFSFRLKTPNDRDIENSFYNKRLDSQGQWSIHTINYKINPFKVKGIIRLQKQLALK